jgi:hypothetical protein
VAANRTFTKPKAIARIRPKQLDCEPIARERQGS